MQRSTDDRPGRALTWPCWLLGACLLMIVASACGSRGAGAPPDVQVSTPAIASATAQPEVTAAPAASPSPTPTAVPPPPPLPFEPTSATVVLPTTTRAAPSMSARGIRELAAGATVDLVAAERGDNWIIGEQDWVPLSHEWERTWYRLPDDSYVYRPFVMLAGDGVPAARASAERYVIVDLGAQTAWAMEGDRPARKMHVTTGSADFETPTGAFAVQTRVHNERMTSSSAGFDQSEFYDVQNVLFTQYFAAGGFAMHLNYWQPVSVFGVTPTSHGCIGMLLADAQFLWLFGSSNMRVIIRESGGPTPAAAPTPAVTPSPTPGPTATPSPSPTATRAPSVTPTPAASTPPSPSSSASPPALPTATPSATPASITP